MNVNFGLFPPLSETEIAEAGGRKAGARARKSLMSRRALAAIEPWAIAGKVA
jgi:hypothetical protein